MADKLRFDSSRFSNSRAAMKEHVYHTFTRVKIARYVAEFVGTFYLLFFITLSGALGNAHAAFAIGFALMILVYKYGYISGGHFNPAVTIGIIFRGGLDSFPNNDYGQIGMYIASQCMGSIFGALIGTGVGGHKACLVYTTVGDHHHIAQAFFAELFCTYWLVSTVLHVGTHQTGNQFYGLGIGCSLLITIISMASISGSAINPAVWLGTVISSAICGIHVEYQYGWAYWVSEIFGGILAGYSFRYFYYAVDSYQAITENDKPTKLVSDNNVSRTGFESSNLV